MVFGGESLEKEKKKVEMKLPPTKNFLSLLDFVIFGHFQLLVWSFRLLFFCFAQEKEKKTLAILSW